MTLIGFSDFQTREPGGPCRKKLVICPDSSIVNESNWFDKFEWPGICTKHTRKVLYSNVFRERDGDFLSKHCINNFKRAK